MNAVKNLKDMEKPMKSLRVKRKELSKKDGQANKRVESWRGDIKVLTDKNKHQVKLLEALEKKGKGEGGDQAGGITTANSHSRDYFVMIISKMAKDIEDLARTAQRVLCLDRKKESTKVESIKQDWADMRQKIRNEAHRALALANESSANKL